MRNETTESQKCDSIMNNSIQPIKKENRIAMLLRWIAVLPIAIVAFFGVQILVSLVSFLRSGMEVDYLSQFICSIVGPYFLVLVGAKTAPSYRFITALVLVIIHAIADSSIVTLAVVIAERQPTSIWWIILCSIVGVIASMLACLQFRNNGDEQQISQKINKL